MMNTTTLKTAVIGVGYLGNFHAQKFAALPETDLIAVCDIDVSRCDEMAQAHNTQAVYDYRQLIGKVDAVSIAVPTTLHHEVAKAFLSTGTHVLLEKPIASSLVEADDLIHTAKENNVILQIGHLERFNSVLVALDKVLDHPRFIDSVRIAPFKIRGTDINVILDLMIHDIDILQTILGSKIVSIHANGAPVLSDEIDLANARLRFENGCVANVAASRVSFKAERKLRIFQHDAYITVDMHNKKLAIHRKGKSEMFPGVPDIIHEEQVFEQSDALKDEIQAFIHSILHDEPATVSGVDGRNALATAIEITRIVTQDVEDYYANLHREAEDLFA